MRNITNFTILAVTIKRDTHGPRVGKSMYNVNEINRKLFTTMIGMQSIINCAILAVDMNTVTHEGSGLGELGNTYIGNRYGILALRMIVMQKMATGCNNSRSTLYKYAMPTLAWHICFIIPYKPQFGKISMKTTAGRSSEKGGRFAGGHFAGGHDGMANLCKPITAYDFHVRYNKNEYVPSTLLVSIWD